MRTRYQPFCWLLYTLMQLLAGKALAQTDADTVVLKHMNEVVVVAYGTQQQATLTGSVASITGAALNTATNGNLTNLMAGKLPGLRVVQNTSEPGNYAASFDIRGFGRALIIVDGVPRNEFNRIAPHEIASVSILKDAAAAVYGVRAANGVVLITTKRGRAGKVELSYNATIGWSAITHTPAVMNAYEFATLTNETDFNSGKTVPTFSKDELLQWKNGLGLAETNWEQLVMRKYTPQTQHNLSARGGNEKMSYFLSLGYYRESGIWKSGDLHHRRYNLRSNITAQISPNLEAELLLGAIQDEKQEPGEPTATIMKSLWMQKPTIPVYANNNPLYLSSVADATHPLAVTDAGIAGYTKNRLKTFQGTFALHYKVPFVSGLKARASYSYDSKYLYSKQWQKKYALYDYDAATQSYIPTYGHDPSGLTESFDEVTQSVWQTSLNYERTFYTQHHVKALLLFEQLQQTPNNFSGNSGFSLNAVDQLYAGNAQNQTITSSAYSPFFGSEDDPVYERVNMGVVGRLNYEYAGKYLVEGSFRYDGSSRFAKGHRWGFFPALSAGWRITEERFLKNKIRFLDHVKLRASWGRMGDDRASQYQFLAGYNYPAYNDDRTVNYIFGDETINGLGFRGLPNPGISWYTATTINIGLDADLWKGRLHIAADLFRRRRTGLLSTRSLSLPGTIGAALPEENLNSDQQQGFELLLGHRHTIRGFSYSLSGNVSVTRSKNLYVEGAANRGWQYNTAYSWNDAYWGYQVLGQFRSEDEIKASPIQDGQGNNTLLPGDLKYEDYNHDGVIDDDDVQPIGRYSPTPQISFGATLEAQWKGFDLNLLFQGAARFTVVYEEQLKTPLPWGRNGLAMFMDRWHKADPFDPNSTWIPGKYPSTRPNGAFPLNYAPSSFWLRNAAYLRLKSMELGYSIPEKALGKKTIHALRIYANGFNLLTWSGMAGIIDPEHTMDSNGYEYPITKNYNVGVHVIF